MTVKVTQIHKHRRSITMAANRHSPRTTTSSSSLLHRVVIFLSSFNIERRSDFVLRNGDSPDLGSAPFSIRISSSKSRPDSIHLDWRSWTTMSWSRVLSIVSLVCLFCACPGRFIHRSQARRPFTHSLTSNIN